MSVLEKSVLIRTSFRRVGNSRQAKFTPQQTKMLAEGVPSDKLGQVIALNKNLLVSSELEAIAKHDGEVSRWLSDRCLPSPFGKGVLLLPLEMVEEVEAHLNESLAKRAVLVDSFCTAYPSRVDEAKGILGNLFNPAQYPKEVRSRFGMEWQYITLTAPETLKELFPDLYERELEAVRRKWNDAETQVRDALREGFATLVESMTERLTPASDGRKKIFRDSLVTNLTEFMGMFESRDLTNDTETQELIAKAKGILAGVTPSELRTNDSTRERVKKGMESLAESLPVVEVDRQLEID